MSNLNWVFDKEIKPRQSAKDVVEVSFPDEHYGEIMTYEAWPMRRIMENLVEIALQKADEQLRYSGDINNSLRQDIKDLKKELEEAKITIATMNAMRGKV